MGNKTHFKSIKREILSSKARFASILAIIFLGVAFFSGIKSSGPDMNESINDFYKEHNLMDSKIVSSLGLNNKDIELLKDNDKILDYKATSSIDVNLTNINSVVKFIGHNSKDKSDINEFEIINGRLPQKSGEIALDKNALKSNKKLKIGDTYTIEGDKDSIKSFKKDTYKIVGFVKSPMYIDKESRGTTTVGKGSVDYFAVIDSSDMDMDVYTEIYVRFKNVKGLDAYSDEYKHKMDKNNNYLKKLYSKRSVERIDEVKADAQKEFDKAYKKIEDGEKKLSDAKEKIKSGKKELTSGKEEYLRGVADFDKQIKDGENKLIEGQRELDKQKEQFESGQVQLDNAKSELDNAKNELLNQGINPDKGTLEYESQIEGLNTLIGTYNNLSNDIKSTVDNTSKVESIPIEKIQYWKAMISNPELGLTDLSDVVNLLGDTPTNTDLALNISSGVNSASEAAQNNKSKLETLVAGITQYQNGLNKYNEQVDLFNNGKEQLKDAQNQLDKGKVDLEKGKKEGQEKLNKAKKQLDDAQSEIDKGEKEIKENEQKLIDGRKEVDKEKEKLNDLDKSKYFYFDREDNPGYATYKDSIKSLDNIATVFPIFFFLIAVLICLTTMTRMVEENRIEIGTLKALGYSDMEIAKKFVVYAALASITGGIIGIVVGSNVFPYIISQSYGSMFEVPSVKINYYPSLVIQSIIASILCTVGASLFVLRAELKDSPSDLMRAKAPKLGKKILLERITPLWSRLNFNQKVTFRNLFRYKQRMVMTIFGIAGCTAMLVTGLSLDKSNGLILERQFNKIWKYDAIVVFNDKQTKEEDKQYEDALSKLNGYESSLNVHQESVSFTKEGMNKQSAVVYVPQDINKLDDYVLLNNRASEEKYKLSNDGVVISEKLANLLNASVGDEVTLQDEDENSYRVKVDKIMENYAGHFVYISPIYYKKVFDEKLEYNAQLLNFKENTNEDNILNKLMNCDKVINVTLKSKLESTSADADLGLVMLVIIISSGSLAFVVLYNLININVSERIRELSTIKVLGFFDNEVTMYIFRENIILTILGILVGSVMGKMLYLFVIGTAETDNAMMIPTVFMSSYIFAGLITMIFAGLVMFMMHIKLKNVNMIDALKSVE